MGTKMKPNAKKRIRIKKSIVPEKMIIKDLGNYIYIKGKLVKAN